MVNNQFIGTMNYGFMSGGFVSTWVPYHNGLAVSEPSFYRIIGDWNTAAKAQTWQNWKYGFAWTGVGIILAACAGSILYYAKTNDPDGSIGIIGLGTGAGFIPVTVAICLDKTLDRYLMPYISPKSTTRQINNPTVRRMARKSQIKGRIASGREKAPNTSDPVRATFSLHVVPRDDLP